MAKTEKTKTLERTYNIPLRKEYLKVPRWRRTNKAVIAARQFLQRHMKSEQIKLGPHLNQKLWQHGIKNPPHHIKVAVIKDSQNIVKAELFGHPIEEKKKEAKKPSKLEEVAKKVGLKVPQPEKKTQEKPEESSPPKAEEKTPEPEKKVNQQVKEKALQSKKEPA